MSIKVELKPISVIEARIGIQPNGPVHKFFTHTCAIHIDKYVPYRTGTLAGTVVENGNTTSNVTTDKIIYAQNYAVYVYKGIVKGKNINYRLDKHPLAGPYWDQRMWSAEKDKVIREVQKYVRKNGGN